MEPTGPSRIGAEEEEPCCSAYQQPDARGEKSPALRRQMKLHCVLEIHATKICQSPSIVFKFMQGNVKLEVNYDMNAIPSNTVDGKSMT